MASKTSLIALARFQKITALYTYALFSVLLLSIVVWIVIPFGTLFAEPNAIKTNVALALISLVLGAVLPLLLSYIIGDKVTHGKNKQLHRFNGALFALLSYWVSLFFSFLSFEFINAIHSSFTEPYATIISSWPIAATLIVMAIIAWPYAHAPGKTSLLESPYFRAASVASIVAVHGYIMYNLFRYGSDESILIMVPTYCLALIVLFAASYKILSPLFSASGTRVTAAIIATSIAYIATTYAGQLLSTATYDAVTIVAPLLIGILAWGTFLVLARGKA